MGCGLKYGQIASLLFPKRSFMAEESFTKVTDSVTIKIKPAEEVKDEKK